MLRKRIKDAAKAIFFALRGIGLSLLTLPLRPAWPVGSRLRPETIHKILVIRLDRLGDLAMTLPTIISLKRRWPDAELTLVCREATAPLAQAQSAIDRVIAVPERDQAKAMGWPSTALSERLRAQRYDLVVDPFTGEETGPAILAWESRARHRLGFSTAGRGGFFTKSIAPDRRQSFIEQQQSLLAAIDVPLEVQEPWLIVTQAERSAALQRLRGAGLDPARPILGIHPGGYYSTQRWPLGRFVELAKRLEHEQWQVAFFGTRAEERLIAQLGADVGARLAVCFGLELREFISMLGCCRLVVCNNSGPLHLAAALGVPTVSTMGPTDPVRWQPVGERHVVIRKELWCSPCQEAECPLGTHQCLMDISVDEMVEAVRDLTAGESLAAPSGGQAPALAVVRRVVGEKW